MKKFFYSHPETVIVTLAIILVVMLGVFSAWAINDIFLGVHQALTFSPQASSENFDLTAAAKLDLRGLVSATSSITGGATISPTSTPTSTPRAAGATSTATTTGK